MSRTRNPRKGEPETAAEPRRQDPRVSATLNLESHVPALLVFLANKFTVGVSNLYLKNFGIGVIEWRCMALLAIEPWIAPNRICQVIGLDKAAVSRSVRALEKKGLVEVRSSQRRARYLEVAMTDEGCRLYERMIRVAFERERRLMVDIAPGERKALVDMLNRMLRRMPEVNGPVDIPNG